MTTPKKPKHTKSFFSIKAKVALLCTSFIIIAVVINVLFIVHVSKETITDNTEITMHSLAKSYSNNISETVMKASETVNFIMSSGSISEFVSSGGTLYTDEVEELVTMYLNTNTSNEKVSIVDANGFILYSSDSTMNGKDITSEPYFTEMVAKGLRAQSEVFTSENSGDACITFAIPLRDGMGVPSSPLPGTQMQEVAVEEFNGAIITDIKVSEISSSLSTEAIGNYETGYAFILDANGMFIYHPEESLIGTTADVQNIQDIVTQLKNGVTPESEVVTFSYEGVKKYAGYNVMDNGWIMFITADESEILASLAEVSTQSFYISVVIIVLLTIVAYIFAGSITKSIKKITLLINKTAELDFTTDESFLKLSSRKDETGEMSRAIEKMRDILNKMILQISDISGKISESTEKMNTISRSVNDHASDNSATAEELSAGMEETAATTEQITAVIEQISEKTREMNDKVTAGTQISNQLIQRAEQLKSATLRSTEKTRIVYEEVKARTDAAIEQSKAVEKINILSKTIKDIASQTSLLALNASIEAARAGDAGSGFSVVASEIGNLANQSSKTVSNITDIVNEVYLAVDNMSNSLLQTLNFLEKNVQADYNEFLNNSEQYNTDAESMNQTMESIHQQIDALNINVQGISESINDINMMVNEASQGVSDVAEKNTNIVGLTCNTQSIAKENSDYATSLSNIVEKFKLE